MNDIKEVIQKIYDNMIDIIIKDFEEEEISAAQNEYLRILNKRCLALNAKLTVKDYNLIYEKMLKMEYNEWGNMAVGVRKQYLLNDEVFEEICNIAGAAYNFAKDRLNNNTLISKSLAEEYINKLVELSENVKDYNKYLANRHISEGSMDLKFASGQTEYTSLRIGHLR